MNFEQNLAVFCLDGINDVSVGHRQIWPPFALHRETRGLDLVLPAQTSQVAKGTFYIFDSNRFSLRTQWEWWEWPFLEQRHLPSRQVKLSY
jgi:hypothetical protein